MRFSGFDTYLPRLAAFVFVNVIAGVLRALHVLNSGFVSPESLGLSVSTNALVAALIGGVASSTGPIVGGVIFAFAQDQFGARGFTQLLTGSRSWCSSCSFRAAWSALSARFARRVWRGRNRGGRLNARDRQALRQLRPVHALAGVDLEIAGEGVLHGVIGPNGAGKSTLLDAVSGRRRPTAGAIRYRGEDITRNRSPGAAAAAWRGRFSAPTFFQDLTVREQLSLVAWRLGDDRLGDVIEVDGSRRLSRREGRTDRLWRAASGRRGAGADRPAATPVMDEPGAGLSAEETLRLFQHVRDLVGERAASRRSSSSTTSTLSSPAAGS